MAPLPLPSAPLLCCPLALSAVVACPSGVLAVGPFVVLAAYVSRWLLAPLVPASLLCWLLFFCAGCWLSTFPACAFAVLAVGSSGFAACSSVVLDAGYLRCLLLFCTGCCPPVFAAC